MNNAHGSFMEADAIDCAWMASDITGVWVIYIVQMTLEVVVSDDIIKSDPVLDFKSGDFEKSTRIEELAVSCGQEHIRRDQ
jgi:hypothetical protein